MTLVEDSEELLLCNSHTKSSMLPTLGAIPTLRTADRYNTTAHIDLTRSVSEVNVRSAPFAFTMGEIGEMPAAAMRQRTRLIVAPADAKKASNIKTATYPALRCLHFHPVAAASMEQVVAPTTTPPPIRRKLLGVLGGGSKARSST